MTGGIIKNAAGGKLATLTAQTVTNDVISYTAKVLALFGTAIVAYWDLNDQAGTAAVDIKNGLNGTISGATLGQPGIGDGKTAMSFDGTDDYIDIYSAGLNTGFSGLLGAMSIWMKVAAAGVWTDGANRASMAVATAGSGRNMYFRKKSDNNTLRAIYEDNASLKNVEITATTTAWFHLGIDWSKAADEVRVWFNGTQSGATVNGIGNAWPALDSTLCAIGALNNAGALPWAGWLAHAVVFNRRLTAPEWLSLATVA
jgi:hypothetical protein